jgi:hypothetical protein
MEFLQVSYAIGLAEPLSITVFDYGTSELSSDQLLSIVKKNFDLRPGRIVKYALSVIIHADTFLYCFFSMCPQGFESAQSNLSADQHLRPLWQGHIPLGAAPEISPVMKRQVIPAASRAALCECVCETHRLLACDFPIKSRAVKVVVLHSTLFSTKPFQPYILAFKGIDSNVSQC